MFFKSARTLTYNRHFVFFNSQSDLFLNSNLLKIQDLHALKVLVAFQGVFCRRHWRSFQRALFLIENNFLY